MNLWLHYICPATLHDALLALRDAPTPAAPVGGGTDLLIDLRQGRHVPANTLVDLTSVREMNALETRSKAICFVGLRRDFMSLESAYSIS